MNATCQITQATTDRIRLHVPTLATQPEVSQFLVQFVLQLPGVMGIEIRPASACVVILHDGAISTRDSILQTLRGKQIPDGASKDEVAPIDPSRLTVASPYAPCEVIHAMRGRVRLRMPVVRIQPTLAGVLEHYLGRQAGITDVRLNHLAETVVVQYDPAAFDFESIVALVKAYHPDIAEIEQWQSAQRSAGAIRDHKHQLGLVMAVAALVLSLATHGSASALVYGLLLGSSWAILWPAYKSLVKDRRLTADTLYATTLVLLCLTGMVWQAALLNILRFSLQSIRSSMHKHAAPGAASVPISELIPTSTSPQEVYATPHTASSLRQADYDGNQLSQLRRRILHRPAILHRWDALAGRRSHHVDWAPGLQPDGDRWHQAFPEHEKQLRRK